MEIPDQRSFAMPLTYAECKGLPFWGNYRQGKQAAKSFFNRLLRTSYTFLEFDAIRGGAYAPEEFQCSRPVFTGAPIR